MAYAGKLNGDGVNDTEGITGMERTAFKASGYAWRLYTGPQAIERGLVESVDRPVRSGSLLFVRPP